MDPDPYSEFGSESYTSKYIFYDTFFPLKFL